MLNLTLRSPEVAEQFLMEAAKHHLNLNLNLNSNNTLNLMAKTLIMMHQQQQHVALHHMVNRPNQLVRQLRQVRSIKWGHRGVDDMDQELWRANKVAM